MSSLFLFIWILSYWRLAEVTSFIQLVHSKDTNRIHHSIWLSRGLCIILGVQLQEKEETVCMGCWDGGSASANWPEKNENSAPGSIVSGPWVISTHKDIGNLHFAIHAPVSSCFSSTDRCVFGRILLSIGQTCFPGWRSQINIIFYFHMFRK